MDDRLAALTHEVDKIMSIGPIGRWTNPPTTFPMMSETISIVALVVHPSAGIAAQSSKPKEIVVVGSKIKAKQKEKAAGQAKRKTLGNTKWGDIELKR